MIYQDLFDLDHLYAVILCITFLEKCFTISLSRNFKIRLPGQGVYHCICPYFRTIIAAKNTVIFCLSGLSQTPTF